MNTNIITDDMGFIKCRQCGAKHFVDSEHEYNLTYQYWLNRELEKVDSVIKSWSNGK